MVVLVAVPSMTDSTTAGGLVVRGVIPVTEELVAVVTHFRAEVRVDTVLEVLVAGEVVVVQVALTLEQAVVSGYLAQELRAEVQVRSGVQVSPAQVVSVLSMVEV